jgi:anti-sigma factor RsiW
MHHLMMAALDGEIGPEEREEFDRALDRDTALRKEWERMTRVKEVTAEMTLREPPAEVWDDYWEDIYRRNERKVAWILVSIGASLLLGYGIFEFVREIVGDSTLPVIVKGGLLFAALGGAILVVSVIRERLFLHRRDPYREVQR